MSRAIASVVFILCGFSALAGAQPRHYGIRAAIDDDGTVHGVVRIDVRARGELRLWVYPDRLAVAPTAINQQNARWIFPREIDTSEVSLSATIAGREVPLRWEREPVGEAGGRDFRGGDVVLTLPPGDEHRVEVTFAYRLPERFGRLGRVRERLGRLGRIGERFTLTAPWYPVVVDDEGATRFRCEHQLALNLPEGFVGMTPRGPATNQIRVRHEGAFVPVVTAREFHRWERELPHGYSLEVVSPVGLYETPSPQARGVARLRDITRVDVIGNIERVARTAVQTLALARVPVEPKTFRVVLTPSRTEMAATAGDMVVVSDRLYEVFPLAEVQIFHDRALRRALFQSALESWVDANEPPIDRDWSEDLRAVLLSDLDEVRRQGRVQTAQDLIGWAGFHPAVDQLLYAPQVAFVDVFFGTVDEPDPFRDHPGRSRNPTARGRRILESARDVLDEDAMRGWSRSLLRRPRPARESLMRANAQMAPRLDTWLASPNTAVNYRLGDVQTEETESGRRHSITVHREGDERIEPVDVRVRDRDGNTAMGTWDGEGDSGVIVIQTPASLRDIQVDPRGRLVQSSRVADGHPRRDDTNRLPWRPPILQGFNLAGSTEGVITGFLDIGLRRRYDLENSVSLRGAFGARSAGGLLRYRRGIGRKRDNNSRIGFVSTGVGVDYLRQFTADDLRGVRVSALVSAGYSTQRYFLDPRKGSILVGSVRASFVRRENGDTSYTFAPSIRGNLTLAAGLRAATVLVGGVNWVFGDPLNSERPGLGGRFLLRGYQTNEAVGRGRAFLVIEQRFTPTLFSDLNLNILNLAWIREIQLAIFAGAGAVFLEPGEDGRDVVPGVEVGGGARFHFDYGGIQPGVLALDVGVPLVRRASLVGVLPPITFIVAFEQYF